MQEKEDLRIRKTKATLLNGLSNLLKTKSFVKITITDICKQAKINRSTFYEHYNEKEDLLKDLIIEATRDLENHLEVSKEITSKKEIFLQIMEFVCNYLEENSTLFSSFPHVDDIFLQIEAMVEKKYCDIIQKNCKDKMLLKDDIAAFYISGGIHLLQRQEHYQAKEFIPKLKKIMTDLD